MNSRRPSPREPPGPDLKDRLRRYASEFRSLIGRNERHQDRLEQVDDRIAVSGTRGKSTMTRWLHDELVERDIDTYAKITGDYPLSVYNGLEWVIPRSDRVTLYENERQIRRFFPMEAMVIENQGITPYTTRLVNSRYVDPTLIVATNIREDHLDTLGENREEIARGIARSIPSDSRVMCGERNDAIRRYFAAELDRRGSTVRYVDVPPEYDGVPGAETVFLLDEVLREIEGRGLRDERAEEYLESLAVEWSTLPEGRVFNAASVNDVQSTEAVRRALLEDPSDVITPLVYLRRDRPGRTSSFARYLNTLHDDGLIETAHLVNGHAKPFDSRTSFSVEIHAPDDDPESVLDDVLAEGNPAILMGNATPEFMRELDDFIATTAVAEPAEPGGNGSVSIQTSIEEGEQVLLLESPHTEASDELCVDLLSTHEQDCCYFLGVEQTPVEQLERWRNHSPDSAATSPKVVSATAMARSTAAASPSIEATLPGIDGSIHLVDDIYDMLTELESLVVDLEPDASISLCFDSVSRLVEDHSTEDAFRMLYAMITELQKAGISAHYHFSTTGHDELDVRTINELFDTTITVNEAGDQRIND